MRLGRRLILSVLLLGSVLLTGCDPPLTSKRTVEQVQAVEIARDAYFELLPLSEAELQGSYNQTITIEYGDNHQTFLSQLEIDSQQLTMVGLATFGARIFTLEFDGERLQFFTIPQVAARLSPEHLLAEFQLASWPIDPIREQMKNSKPKTYWLSAPRKLHIEESDNNRSIYFGGLKIINIDYEDLPDKSKKIVFKNLERGYTLHIKQFPEIDF
mgnify:CR=1 FL=1